jgi:hypothetical protein
MRRLVGADSLRSDNAARARPAAALRQHGPDALRSEGDGKVTESVPSRAVASVGVTSPSRLGR